MQKSDYGPLSFDDVLTSRIGNALVRVVVRLEKNPFAAIAALTLRDAAGRGRRCGQCASSVQ